MPFPFAILIWIVVIAFIFCIVLYFVGQIPDATIQKWARLAVLIVAAFTAIYFLLSFLPPLPHGRY